MRILWEDYVRNQLAWWAALSKLSADPSVDNRVYVSAKAEAAYANARAVAVPFRRLSAPDAVHRA